MKSYLCGSLLALPLLLLGDQSPVRAQDFPHTTATIAAWNLDGFGGIPAERLEKQIDGLAVLDAEVVALVEVNPPEALEILRQGLEDKGGCYHKTMLEQTSGSDLHIGILFKCGVKVGPVSFVPGSDLGEPGLRDALTAEVEIGKFDFRIVVVHLKSGRRASAQKIRDAEARVIADFIRKTLKQSPDEDILLVGDFNMIPGQDVSNFYNLGGDGDLMDFLSSWDMQGDFSHMLHTGRADLLDGFAITRHNSAEYIRGSLRIFPMHWTMERGQEWFRDNVSDHLPFVATFRIEGD